MVLILSEVHGKAVGMMSLTTGVDLDLLRSSFCLESYDLTERGVFCVTMFCLTDEYQSRAIDFFKVYIILEIVVILIIKPSFDLFPSAEYMIITLPYNYQERSLIPFLTYVKPERGSPFPYAFQIR
jgi:hypothetical protein